MGEDETTTPYCFKPKRMIPFQKRRIQPQQLTSLLNRPNLPHAKSWDGAVHTSW